MSNTTYALQPIIEFYFMGWRATGFDLQESGWSVHMEEVADPLRYETAVHFYLKNNALSLCGMSRPFVDREILSKVRYQGFTGLGEPGEHTLMININRIGHSDNYYVERNYDILRENIREVNISPYPVEMKSMCLSEIFPTRDDNVVFVEKEADWEVIDHLKRIKELQQDGQDEYRQRLMLKQYREGKIDSAVETNNVICI